MNWDGLQVGCKMLVVQAPHGEYIYGRSRVCLVCGLHNTYYTVVDTNTGEFLMPPQEHLKDVCDILDMSLEIGSVSHIDWF